VVTIAGNRGVLLAAGGGYFKINESGEVESGSPIKFTIKANMASDDPASMNVLSEMVPQNFHSQFHFVDDDDYPVVNAPYVYVDDYGHFIHGTTDLEGKTKLYDSILPNSGVAHLIQKGESND
jgi:uncharacterized protein (DUF2345 family)